MNIDASEGEEWFRRGTERVHKGRKCAARLQNRKAAGADQIDK